MTVRMLCLLGPTGTGKTDASLILAEAFRGSVVNFDSRQFYREVPITTAQPSAREQARCPHLLYGCIACRQPMSAGLFADMAAPALRRVLDQGRTPILVGGTGLYLRALLEGLAPIPDVPEPVRETVFAQWDDLGGAAMHRKLTEVDPDYAARVHPNDRQRVTRALEVHAATGRPFTHWHTRAEGAFPASCLRIGLRLDKPALDDRLARRIDAMLEAGAVEEIRAAMASCPDVPNAPGLSGIGCAELAAHLRGEMDLEQACALWLSNTKAYAKRQMTWFKKDPSVRWFAPNDTDAMLDLARAWMAGQED